jgi:hypothetical protein
VAGSGRGGVKCPSVISSTKHLKNHCCWSKPVLILVGKPSVYTNTPCSIFLLARNKSDYRKDEWSATEGCMAPRLDLYLQARCTIFPSSNQYHPSEMDPGVSAVPVNLLSKA